MLAWRLTALAADSPRQCASLLRIEQLRGPVLNLKGPLRARDRCHLLPPPSEGKLEHCSVVADDKVGSLAYRDSDRVAQLG